jgi:glyceraldehyde 3-phosphate dehydrogenase
MEENGMSKRVVINGFGRMGKLGFRAGWSKTELDIVRINDPAGDAECMAHLINFDSVHGRWEQEASAENGQIRVGDALIDYSMQRELEAQDWSGVDLVIDTTGKHRSPELLQPYFDAGVKKVLVSAPVHEGAVNIVIGVNDDDYRPDEHNIITAASCTTNCLAPVVKVLHEGVGIRHGSITTIHDITNTQTILDSAHKDLRRARACGMNLIPTSTGSATAIGKIFPELQGRLDGIAVRVPLANASITDCVFEVARKTSIEEVNSLFEQAADGPLAGILGFETRPLVSTDYTHDPRSSIVDAEYTRVTQGTQVKVLAWYDNEWGYANRLMELAARIARDL